MNYKVIVFADLDGTILDDNYSYSEVEPIIRKLLLLKTSIVLASSKTKAEVEFYRRKLRLREPFIVENGSAIIIPQEYFKTRYQSTKQNEFYRAIKLGVDYTSIRNKLALIQKSTNSTIIGFGDMTVKEIACETNLPINLVELAKRREYDEPFRIINGKESDILKAIKEAGLSYTKGGRYFHLLGNTDKGKALAVLKELYLQEFRRIVTIGVGDSANDLPMLKLVNKHFMINDQKSILNVWQKILEVAKEYSR